MKIKNKFHKIIKNAKRKKKRKNSNFFNRTFGWKTLPKPYEDEEIISENNKR